MAFLALALGYVGYVLVYAAIANHGRFATSPWVGVLADAYDPHPAQPATTGKGKKTPVPPTSGGSPTPTIPRQPQGGVVT